MVADGHLVRQTAQIPLQARNLGSEPVTPSAQGIGRTTGNRGAHSSTVAFESPPAFLLSVLGGLPSVADLVRQLLRLLDEVVARGLLEVLELLVGLLVGVLVDLRRAPADADLHDLGVGELLLELLQRGRRLLLRREDARSRRCTRPASRLPYSSESRAPTSVAPLPCASALAAATSSGVVDALRQRRQLDGPAVVARPLAGERRRARRCPPPPWTFTLTSGVGAAATRTIVCRGSSSPPPSSRPKTRPRAGARPARRRPTATTARGRGAR